MAATVSAVMETTSFEERSRESFVHDFDGMFGVHEKTKKSEFAGTSKKKGEQSDPQFERLRRATGGRRAPEGRGKGNSEKPIKGAAQTPPLSQADRELGQAVHENEHQAEAGAQN